MEAQKKSLICTKIRQVGPEDQYGNIAYSVDFQDGTHGFFKCKNQDLFTEGQASTFYIEEAIGRTGTKYNKITRVSAHENEWKKNKNFSKNLQNEDRNRSFALAYAKDLYVAHWSSGEIPVPNPVPNPVEITQYAQVFLDWLNEKDEPEEEEKEEIKDELPF